MPKPAYIGAPPEYFNADVCPCCGSDLAQLTYVFVRSDPITIAALWSLLPAMQVQYRIRRGNNLFYLDLAFHNADPIAGRDVRELEADEHLRGCFVRLSDEQRSKSLG